MTSTGYLRKQDGLQVLMILKVSLGMRKQPYSIHFLVRIFRAPCKPSVGSVRQASAAELPLPLVAWELPFECWPWHTE